MKKKRRIESKSDWKTIIIRYFCIGEYLKTIWMIALEKQALRIGPIKRRLLHIGYIKIIDGKLDTHSIDSQLRRNLYSPNPFLPRGIFVMYGMGTVPFWSMIGRMIAGRSFFYWIILTFIPILIIVQAIVHLLEKGDNWRRCCRELINMDSKKRKRIIITSCIAKVFIILTLIMIYIVCVPLA